VAGVGDGLARLTSHLPAVSGSFWSQLRASWSQPGMVGMSTLPEEMVRSNNLNYAVCVLLGSRLCRIEGVDVGGLT
jgi:hypothetical protein